MADRLTEQSVEVAVAPITNARTTVETLEAAYSTSVRKITTQESVEVAYLGKPYLVTQESLEAAYSAAPPAHYRITQEAVEAAFRLPRNLITQELLEAALLPMRGLVTSVLFERAMSPPPGAQANRLFAVSAFHQTPYLLVARKDIHQVSALDLYTPVPQRHVIWRTPPIDGGPEMRGVRKRFRRLRLYGEGTLSPVDAGRVTFIADRGQRTQTFTLSASTADPRQRILLIQETGVNLVGRVIEVVIDLNGSGLILREVQLEYNVLN